MSADHRWFTAKTGKAKPASAMALSMTKAKAKALGALSPLPNPSQPALHPFGHPPGFAPAPLPFPPLDHAQASAAQGVYYRFSRAQWAQMVQEIGLPAAHDPLADMEATAQAHGVSVEELTQVYHPLAKLLAHKARVKLGLLPEEAFPNLAGSSHEIGVSPLLVGIAGGVSVGKTTLAQLLTHLIAQESGRPEVALISTDGFLYPNAQIESRSGLRRKGFPESYDTDSLLEFLCLVRQGQPAQAPVYSHRGYDIVPGQTQAVKHAHIVIVEGLNVLQTVRPSWADAQPNPMSNGADAFCGPGEVNLANLMDVSLFIDASVEHMRAWYLARFHRLRRQALADPASYFARYAALDERAATQHASTVWAEVNEKNLREHILPSREHAHLILHKGESHQVDAVFLQAGEG